MVFVNSIVGMISFLEKDDLRMDIFPVLWAFGEFFR